MPGTEMEEAATSRGLPGLPVPTSRWTEARKRSSVVASQVKLPPVMLAAHIKAPV